MNRFEFQGFVDELEKAFWPVDRDEEKRVAALDLYYERLRYALEEDMRKAVKYLLDTHEKKAFPLISEIKAAIDKCAKLIPDEINKSKCMDCGGQGVAIVKINDDPMYNTTLKPCHCDAGRIWRRRAEEWRVKRGIDIDAQKMEEETPF